jgi:exodeoxyribonuclease-3
VGWRIDYFCVSRVLSEHLVSASILCDVMGSDHCPVSIVVKDLFE